MKSVYAEVLMQVLSIKPFDTVFVSDGNRRGWICTILPEQKKAEGRAPLAARCRFSSEDMPSKIIIANSSRVSVPSADV